MSLIVLGYYNMSLFQEIVFMGLLGINIIAIPFLITHSKIKKQKIKNPMINLSYSSISTLILDLLRLLLYIQFITNFVMLAYIIFSQFIFLSYDQYKNRKSKFISLTSLNYIPPVLIDLNLNVQVYEYLIMIYSIFYIGNKNIMQLMQQLKS